MAEEPAAGEEKRRLRAELRAFRQSLDASALARAAECTHAAACDLAALVAARTVVGYAACDGEIDVARLLDDARRRGAAVLLPRRRRGDVLELVAAGADASAPLPVAIGGSGALREPPGPASDPATLAAPAVLLAPAVALDRRGGRLGRGGGDYDRLLPRLRALGWTLVGVCHAGQLVDALPLEAHDVPMDAVLTDAGLLVPAR